MEVKCLERGRYLVSLTIGRHYKCISKRNKLGLLEIVDNTGESYFYPEEWFEVVRDGKRDERHCNKCKDKYPRRGEHDNE